MRINLAMFFMFPFTLLGGVLALIMAGLGVGFRSTMLWLAMHAEARVSRR